MARPTYSEAISKSQQVLVAMLISGQNPDGTSLETEPLAVHQQFQDDGEIANAIKLIDPFSALYLTKLRLRNFASANYVIQVHNTLLAPTNATGLVLKYRVPGSSTGAVDPLIIDLGGGDLFNTGCWLTWHDSWSTPSAWNPVAAGFFNEIDTWHVLRVT